VEEGSYVMVLVTGPEQLSWPALRDHLGTSRMTTASREEVKEVTGYEIGAVAPFGLKQPVRTLVDRSVLSQETISMGSGERGVAVILRARDLMAALDEAEVGTFR
jgi:prolyl-tRNA editing enzyme YbaK/EbsC (Cys-tRNA(Pro) deacylase)